MARTKSTTPEGGGLFAPRRQPKIPFEFVLDELAEAMPVTRPMFGCTAVYLGEKLVLVLREKAEGDEDNGVWLATAPEHHASLRAELPSLRSIRVFGAGETAWQVLPLDAPDFEAAALRACRMVLEGDPRIGKIKGEKKPAAAKKRPGKRAKG